ncbi:MAG TPA: hypothetical protein VF250_12890 [Conexibacter sp.]
MEMSHRGSHGDMSIAISVLEPLDDFMHQPWYVSCVGRLVDDPTVSAGDTDRTCAPAARALVALEAAGVEVEVEDDAIEPAEGGVVGHGAHVVHCAGVAGHRHPVLVARVCGRTSTDDRERLVVGDVEALD